MSYTTEDYATDIEWLREQGVYTGELEGVILNIIKQSFILTKTEFVELVDEIEE